MNLIIIEGEKDKSEERFWRSFIENHISNTKLGCLGGVRKLKRNLDALLGIPKDAEGCRTKTEPQEFTKYEYDNVLVCIDTTARPGEVDNAKFEVIAHQGLKKTNIEFLEYYCFEDCILLFEDLPNWILSDEAKRKMLYENTNYDLKKRDAWYIWKQYYEVGNQRTELDEELDKELLAYADSELRLHDKIEKSRILKREPAITKEQFAGACIIKLTEDTTFRTTKDILSDCWSCSCWGKRCMAARLSENMDGKSIMSIPCNCGLREACLSSERKHRELLEKSLVLRELKNITWLEPLLKMHRTVTAKR